MRFQGRDGQIIREIHTSDGLLARRHIKELFWPTATWRAMEKRLSLLQQARYLDWPTLEQRKQHPIPEPICWLGWRGGQWLAGEQGLAVTGPAKENETHLRLFKRRLRREGFHWTRQPRWSQLAHDLAVVDVRLALERATAQHPMFTLESWLPESVFRAEPDVVDYQYTTPAGRVRRRKKGVRPDGLCVIVNERRRQRGEDHRLRLLLELDNATHADTKFAREKVAAGAAYIKSPAYRARFGYNAGHWLVVVKSEVRLRHLMRVAEQVAGDAGHLFSFATLADVRRHNMLLDPIWHQMGRETAGPLPLN